MVFSSWIIHTTTLHVIVCDLSDRWSPSFSSREIYHSKHVQRDVMYVGRSLKAAFGGHTSPVHHTTFLAKLGPLGRPNHKGNIIIPFFACGMGRHVFCALHLLQSGCSDPETQQRDQSSCLIAPLCSPSLPAINKASEHCSRRPSIMITNAHIKAWIPGKVSEDLRPTGHYKTRLILNLAHHYVHDITWYIGPLFWPVIKCFWGKF